MDEFFSVYEVPEIQLSLEEVAVVFSNLGDKSYNQYNCVHKCEIRR